MINALIINTDSTFSVQEIDGKLKTLQGLVGGWIEAVNTPGGTTLMVNEEGKPTGLPTNELATLLWWQLYPDMAGVDYICGPAVVLGPVDREGDETSVTEYTLKTFARVVTALAANHING